MSCNCKYCQNREFFEAFTGKGKLKDEYMEMKVDSVYQRLESLLDELPTAKLMNEVKEIMDIINEADNELLVLALRLEHTDKTTQEILAIQEKLY